MLGARRGLALSVAMAAAVCALCSAAFAAPTAPLGHSGRWITDAQGRVVILHGVNMVFKRPPYYPAAAGFGADDAAFLEDNGFNTVRLGLIYKGVEPAPGVYDDSYLDQIASTEATLAQHGIYSQLDFHQDLYNERFGGEGWPDWATLDDGLPAEPLTGFPGSYLSSPGLNQAFTNFWLNRAGPGGIGLQDRYALAFRRVAERFASRQHTLGYDLLNEPWPGWLWSTCANPLGCPVFDSTMLAPFHRRVIARIRSVERQKLIWYEPNVIFNFGARTNHPPTGDPQTGFSFHVYCLAGALSIPGLPPVACETLDESVFANADEQAAKTGDALLLSEFGATDDLDVIRRNAEQADRHMVSWQYWHYCECGDPTTQAAGGTQSLVLDAEQPPSGANVKEAKLAVLSRPYPQAVAGTPLRYGFDPDTDRFALSYSTIGPGGRLFGPSSETEVFVGNLHYPNGYSVDLRGGIVASPPNADLLRIRPCTGAIQVSLSVTPAAAGAPPLRGGC